MWLLQPLIKQLHRLALSEQNQNTIRLLVLIPLVKAMENHTLIAVVMEARWECTVGMLRAEKLRKEISAMITEHTLKTVNIIRPKDLRMGARLSQRFLRLNRRLKFLNIKILSRPRLLRHKTQDPYGPTSTIGPDTTPLDPDTKTQEVLHQEAQKFQADLNNGHIKPKTYHDLYEKKDTLGKIGHIFGMLMAGAGSGLSHQPNMMMQMMDKEIERDLEAQKTSAANRQNFLSIAQKGLANQSLTEGQFINNKQAAFALANSYANRLALHDQMQKINSLPEGSKERKDAEMTAAIMAQSIDQKDIDMFSKAGLAAAQAHVIGGGGNTQMMKSGIAGPAMAKIGEDREEKTIENVPSVAGQQATRPIPQAQRDQVQNMNVLRDKAKQLIDFSKKHEGSWDPKTRAKAQQMANELVGFYSSSLGTSMTEGTRTWLDEQVAKKNPTSIIGQELMGSNEKLNEIMKSNNMRQATLLKSLGFRPREEKHSGKSAPKSGSTSKSGKEIIYKDGKAYYK
jgi:hypothetical protein